MRGCVRICLRGFVGSKHALSMLQASWVRGWMRCWVWLSACFMCCVRCFDERFGERLGERFGERLFGTMCKWLCEMFNLNLLQICFRQASRIYHNFLVLANALFNPIIPNFTSNLIIFPLFQAILSTFLLRTTFPGC